MKDGDRCGFAAFCGTSGVLCVEKNGKKLRLIAEQQDMKLNRQRAVESVASSNTQVVPLKKKTTEIYLCVVGDFTDGKDTATLWYSLDGKEFEKIGPEVKMRFDISTFFMGTKFAIFNYATKSLGGYVDVDWFRYNG